MGGDTGGGGPWAAAAAATATHLLATAPVTGDPVAQAAYMRDQFPFHGLRMADVEAVWAQTRETVEATHGRPDGDDLVAFAETLWREDEREHQYVAAKALARVARRKDLSRLGPRHLDRIRGLITSKSWWDTVDILAPSVVGRLAARHPDEVLPVLDTWIVHEDVWLVRSALLHQLKWKDAVDRDRLARYCLLAAPHTDFFARKAVGWALRQYSYVDPGWVAAFVAEHEDVLDSLSAREALKAIRRRQG